LNASQQGPDAETSAALALGGQRAQIGRVNLPTSREDVLRRFRHVRGRTEALVAPLSPEDTALQSMPDASPTKWHLAHTTWFFAEFFLARFDPSHRWEDPRWRVLFNSYYEGVGPQHLRSARGLLSRPSLDEILAWRTRVDLRVCDLLAAANDEALAILLLGTHHEEQHQELILTDLKHAFSSNPLLPAYSREPLPPSAATGGAVGPATEWIAHDRCVARIGHDGRGFAFDNEGPEHEAIVGPFLLGSRLVTNGEYAEFIDDGGYDRVDLWLSDGWAAAKAGGWSAPLYWERALGEWTRFTLHGVRPLERHQPVAHVSFFEADAYARWAGARLPVELEWETAARSCVVDGNFVESGLLEPAGRPAESRKVAQLFGDVWEWTGSAYLPYPRYRPLEGTLGEYNGKFMSGQMVLRGGSCLSPRDHLRATYRNFFAPHARWQATGIRLARDA
jgi:ergothioneine biosynthesis protein EgtB